MISYTKINSRKGILIVEGLENTSGQFISSRIILTVQPQETTKSSNDLADFVLNLLKNNALKDDV